MRHGPTIVYDLDTDDFADILQQLPQKITDQVLASLDASDRARVEEVLSYDEDSAGGLMNTDTITIRPRHALEMVFRYLRMAKDLPETTDAAAISAINRNGVLEVSIPKQEKLQPQRIEVQAS